MQWLYDMISDSNWITAIATLFGAITTYLITKNKNKKELAISDRMQLSKEQYRLIAELRQMMVEQKEEIEVLRDEIRELQAVNMNLTIENRDLQIEIRKLNEKLKDMQNFKNN